MGDKAAEASGAREGPWQQVFYAELDGRRRKRVMIKIVGAA